MIKKNEEYIVDVIDQGIEGEGIAKIDNFTVFIPGAIKNERVKIVITKVQSSFAYSKIIEIIKKSKNRIDVDCPTYKQCGGCNLRHMNYEYTLQYKTEKVKNCLNKNSISFDIVRPCIGMEKPMNYRNKLQYPIRTR